MKTKYKRGESALTTPFTLIISLAFLIILTVYVVNIITPFIWYQKLQTIATKYMYVIERYGYLTAKEEQLLEQELVNEGFEKSRLLIKFPTEKQAFGTLFSFEIKYNYEQKYNVIFNGIKNEVRTIPLHIKKYSYSKI